MEHSPEESAHHLLEVFRSVDCEPEEYLNAGAFAYPFTQNGWSMSDYETGLAYCVEREWIRLGTLNRICATRTGLDQLLN